MQNVSFTLQKETNQLPAFIVQLALRRTSFCILHFYFFNSSQFVWLRCSIAGTFGSNTR
jgi:hypothetical protein